MDRPAKPMRPRLESQAAQRPVLTKRASRDKASPCRTLWEIAGQGEGRVQCVGGAERVMGRRRSLIYTSPPPGRGRAWLVFASAE